jgi:hypothetical protein
VAFKLMSKINNMVNPPLVRKSKFSWGWLPILIVGHILAYIPLWIFELIDTGTLRPWIVSSVFILVAGVTPIFVIVFMLFDRHEQRQLNRVMEESWANWLQFDNVADWHKFAEDDYQREQAEFEKDTKTIRAQVVIAIVLLGGLMLFNGQGKPALLALFIVGGAIMALGFIFATRYRKRKTRELYEQRLELPPPRVIIGKYGLYRDDTGYQSLRGLSKVEFVPRQEAEWGQILFTVKDKNANRKDQREKKLVVRVPVENQEAARLLVEWFYSERRLKK